MIQPNRPKETSMKLNVTLSLIFALFASSLAIAQSGGMKGMEMEDTDMQKCMDMKGTNDMKGMDMKDMDMQKCKEMMNGKDKKAENAKAVTHKAVAVVKGVDAANGKVTLAH